MWFSNSGRLSFWVCDTANTAAPYPPFRDKSSGINTTFVIARLERPTRSSAAHPRKMRLRDHGHVARTILHRLMEEALSDFIVFHMLNKARGRSWEPNLQCVQL